MRQTSYLAAFFRIASAVIDFLMARLLYLPLLVSLLLSCQPGAKPPNKFADPGLLKIADLRDRRLPDSLYPYFNHENALYRRDAVNALGSIQDGTQIERIGKVLLMDGDPAVRKAAAFALGQIEDPSCERILLGALVKEKVSEVTYEILQAYGNTTRRWQLDPSSFKNDSLKTAGLAWSIYRAGIRGKADSTSNRVATGLLDPAYAEQTRLGAAHFFARGAKNFENTTAVLCVSAEEDPSASVRMAAALALGKVPSDSSLAALKNVIKQERDSRVTVNAVRALKGFPYNHVKHYLYEALGHKDVNVGIAASEVILETVPDNGWIEVSALTNQATNWRIEANLYGAALKAGKNSDLAAEIQSRYENSKDPYHRAALLGSLSHFPDAYTFVEKALHETDTTIIRSAAAGTLVAMNRSSNFPSTLTTHFAALYTDLLRTQEDPVVIGTIAQALADSTLAYGKYITDVAVLQQAAEKLKLPEHNEVLQAIEAALARLENRKQNPIKNEYNHPINWELIAQIPEDQVATIKTTRGNIVVRLLVNEAPGSVANFVALARDDYFDDKPVHRVVPNFVIQAGCKRGDDWGSEDYSLRSEFYPGSFQTGSMGMASAGKDTEGTQWFITHSPAPHLDGRYTRFAEVREGQAVIDYLQVGDRITDVEVEHFTDE